MSTRKHTGLRPVAAALFLLLLGGTSVVDSTAAIAAVKPHVTTIQTEVVPNRPQVRAVLIDLRDGTRECRRLVDGGAGGYGQVSYGSRFTTVISDGAAIEVTSMATDDCRPGTGYASTSGWVVLANHPRCAVYFDRRPQVIH
jgi:hypothetical protein